MQANSTWRLNNMLNGFTNKHCCKSNKKEIYLYCHARRKVTFCPHPKYSISQSHHCTQALQPQECFHEPQEAINRPSPQNYLSRNSRASLLLAIISFVYKAASHAITPTAFGPEPWSPTCGSLEQERKRVLNDLFELANPFGANSTVDNLVVEAGSDGNLVLPLNTGGAVLVLDRDSNLLGRADGKDSSLRGVDDSSEVVNGVVHAHVGDGDGAALVLLGLELVLTGLLGEFLDRAGDGLEATALNASDDGGDEASGGRDSDGDVNRVELADGLATPAGVDGRDLLGGNGDGLDEEIVDRQLVLTLGRAVESLAELQQLGDGERARDEEVGVVLDRLLETAGNDLANSADREVFVDSAGSSGSGGASGLLDIVLGDLAALAGALESLEADTVLSGESDGGRAGVGGTVKRSLELLAGRGILLGLGSRRARLGGGRGVRLAFLSLGSRGFGVATSILECELFEGGDIGTFFDKDRDWL